MFANIIGKYNQDESQDFHSDNAIEEDSRGYDIHEYRSSLPDMLKTEEVFEN